MRPQNTLLAAIFHYYFEIEITVKLELEEKKGLHDRAQRKAEDASASPGWVTTI
jgi:hypothetical protein